ncbi:MAG: aspartate/tyrosine/aromatic aminotransferase [Burkholderiaceae bacterium]|nr:aspartate/tyrosine/aromatic aminotransferase [Burkholderiaceae bacterium]
MLEQLQPTAGDALLALMGQFRADPRPTKIDVGVGVYRDEHGRTPVMAAVKQAEQQLFNEQDTKTYVGIAGDMKFNAAMVDLVFGEKAQSLQDRVRAVQTTGGCGALRALLDLLALCKPDATVWVSDPTWVNHIPLVKAARLKLAVYPYFDKRGQAVRFNEMTECLSKLGPNDIVLLHGACHNPTGVDLNEAQWLSVAQLAAQRGFLPFIDLAYQGLGRGLDADAFGVRCMADHVPEYVVGVSCSKNFGLYRERVGSAMVVHQDAKTAQLALDNLMVVLRGNYSMPPDHGANVVARILGNEDLRKLWQDELNGMRGRINDLRRALFENFRSHLRSDEFNYIARQQGMFSMLGLSPEQVAMLRERFAIYMPPDSRTNVAGLHIDQIDYFVQAVGAVL